jgi:hypothetical protein
LSTFICNATCVTGELSHKEAHSCSNITVFRQYGLTQAICSETTFPQHSQKKRRWLNTT